MAHIAQLVITVQMVVVPDIMPPATMVQVVQPHIIGVMVREIVLNLAVPLGSV